jgi:hypothetical protein
MIRLARVSEPTLDKFPAIPVTGTYSGRLLSSTAKTGRANSPTSSDAEKIREVFGSRFNLATRRQKVS